MGLTNVVVAIRGPKGSKDVSLVVDTGSEDTWINKRVLKELGWSLDSAEPVGQLTIHFFEGMLGRWK